MRIKGNQISLAVTLVRVDREGELGRDGFHVGYGFKDFSDLWIQRRGARLTREESGREIMGGGLRQDQDVGAEAIQGFFQPLLDGLTKHKRQKNRGRGNRHGHGEKKSPPGIAAELL